MTYYESSVQATLAAKHWNNSGYNKSETESSGSGNYVTMLLCYYVR